MKLFILSYSYYEEYSLHYFMGKDNVSEEEFKILCANLLDEAASLAIKTEDDTCIGWYEIIQAMSILLKKYGYEEFKPIENNFFGPGILQDIDEVSKFSKTVGDKIIEHNLKISNIKW